MRTSSIPGSSGLRACSTARSDAAGVRAAECQPSAADNRTPAAFSFLRRINVASRVTTVSWRDSVLRHRAICNDFVRTKGSGAVLCCAAMKLLRRLRRLVAPDPNRFLRSARGVVHVGANIGQERELYQRCGLEVLW